MNSTQLFNAMCAAMISDQWLEAIQDEIDAMPEVMDFCAPEYVGRLDADEGLSCDPTRYGYRTVLECEAYIISWNAAVELQDYVSGCEDIEFWRRGQW